MLTIAEAATQIGMTRAGLWKAIKRGAVSATKDDKGNYLVDPAELYRVYQPTRQPVSNEIQEGLREVEYLKRENDLLREALEREREQVDRLNAQFTHLLTHEVTTPLQGGDSLLNKLFKRGR